jgi:hypothetical protein
MPNTDQARLRKTLIELQNKSVAQTKALAGISAALRTAEIDSDALCRSAMTLAMQAKETARLAWDIYSAANVPQREA